MSISNRRNLCHDKEKPLSMPPDAPTWLTASAGVIPARTCPCSLSGRFPRACGGDPDYAAAYCQSILSSPRTRGYYQIPRRQRKNTVPFCTHYDPLPLLFTPNGQESAKPQVSKTRGLSSRELRRVMSSHRSGGLRRRALCAAFPCPASASGEGPFQLRRERDAE